MPLQSDVSLFIITVIFLISVSVFILVARKVYRDFIEAKEEREDMIDQGLSVFDRIESHRERIIREDQEAYEIVSRAIKNRKFREGRRFRG